MIFLWTRKSLGNMFIRSTTTNRIKYEKLRSECADPFAESPRRHKKKMMTRTLLIFLFAVGSTTCFYFNLSRREMQTPLDNSIAGHVKLSNIKDKMTDDGKLDSSYKPLWSWLCQEHRCVRTSRPREALAHSWLTCAMVCAPSPLWPEPTGQQMLSHTITLLHSPPYALDITRSTSQAVTDYLKQAFDLFNLDVQKTISTEIQQTKSIGLLVKIKVTRDPDPILRLNTSEQYKLVIGVRNGTSVARIVAESFCGARHALETLAQLVWFDEYIGSVTTFKSALVKDHPMFVYRGLMLDTARNYFPVEDILRTLDAMAATKLNTFHWHATDSQSFPLKLKSVPQFAWYGAYSSRQVYTPEDIKTIVHRARVRGIRVVIEIDGPAHVGRAWSWADATSLGNLATCVEARPWEDYCGEPPCGQLNPLNPHVYHLLRKMFTEIIQLTDVHDVFHIGGDEVNIACWNSTNVDEQWMFYIQHTKRALKQANGGKVPEVTILWSSDLTTYPLDRFRDFVIQLWSDQWSHIHEGVILERHRAIFSNVNAWYLDCGFGPWRTDSEGECIYNSEKTVYEYRPWWRTKQGAMGGEACLWSELVDGSTVDARLWPRAAAVAERLWADPPHNFDPETSYRLDVQRRRLAARGVAARALGSRWCSDNPFECSADGSNELHSP